MDCLFFFSISADKEHDNDPKEMYEVHMRNVEHHHHSSNTPSRLLNIHSQSHPMQSNPPMHQTQKNHHLQQQQSQVSFYNYFLAIVFFFNMWLILCRFYLFIASIATVTESATTATTYRSANTVEWTLYASHTPAIEWRTT